MKKKLLYTGGAITIIFLLLHIAFPYLFAWKTDLIKLSAENRGIFLMLHTETVFLLFASSVVTFKLARKVGKEPFTTSERLIMTTYAIFYILRIVFDPVFFGGFSLNKIPVLGFCFATAICYIVPLIPSKKQSYEHPGIS